MKKVTKICPFNKDHTFRLQLELDHHLPNCKDAVNFYENGNTPIKCHFCGHYELNIKSLQLHLKKCKKRKIDKKDEKEKEKKKERKGMMEANREMAENISATMKRVRTWDKEYRANHCLPFKPPKVVVGADQEKINDQYVQKVDQYMHTQKKRAVRRQARNLMKVTELFDDTEIISNESDIHSRENSLATDFSIELEDEYLSNLMNTSASIIDYSRTPTEFNLNFATSILDFSLYERDKCPKQKLMGDCVGGDLMQGAILDGSLFPDTYSISSECSSSDYDYDNSNSFIFMGDNPTIYSKSQLIGNGIVPSVPKLNKDYDPNLSEIEEELLHSNPDTYEWSSEKIEYEGEGNISSSDFSCPLEEESSLSNYSLCSSNEEKKSFFSDSLLP